VASKSDQAKYLSDLQVAELANKEGKEMKCQRCDGCGKVANTSDGEPWSVWMSLPMASSLGVLSGLVKPIPCPECNGTGTKEKA
jgi:DnaJ-class molecular chaperone